MLKPDISQWVGKTECQQGRLDLSAAQRLSATIGGGVMNVGDPMPYLAHWCAFTPTGEMSELSSDGHPMLGGFLPPVHLKRRMWAGGWLEFHAPLHIGAEIERRSKIAAITEKDGVTGSMVFVSVTHELFEGGTLAISEVQDIVYINIPDAFSPPAPKPTPTSPDLIEAIDISEALLFRFSAATFNAHRIHYDLPYAQQVEKYPGLVVHGPLQAMFMMRAALRHENRLPQKFSFRGIHPMFHFDDLHVFGQDTGDGMSLCTGLIGRHQGMQAKLIWKDTT